MYSVVVSLAKRRFMLDCHDREIMNGKAVNVLLFETEKEAIDFTIEVLVANEEIEDLGNGTYRILNLKTYYDEPVPVDDAGYTLIRFNDQVLSKTGEFLYIVEVDSKIPVGA